MLSCKIQIENKFTLSTRLSVEGPLRLREEYIEGILETPTVIEERVPEQLKGALGQAVSTIQQLPVPLRDAFAGGLKIPFSKIFDVFLDHWFNSVFELEPLVLNQSLDEFSQ